MRDRDWFIVGSRLIGVWVAYTALSYIATYLDIKLSYTTERGGMTHPEGWLIHAFLYGMFSLYLLLGTRHLAWLCYEQDESWKSKRPSSSTASENDLV